MDEGYIKFNCIWQKVDNQISEEIFSQLESARSKLYSLGLIGMYPDGIGFGNISVRGGDAGNFFISGSATGEFVSLRPSDYSLVTGYQLNENTVFCTGQTKASSESLTHAAVYQSIPEVGAVVHVHSLWLWEKLLDHFPSTLAEIEYGTPEMAFAVGQLAFTIKEGEEKIIVMGGHREGILAFGTTLAGATGEVIKIFNQYKYD